MEKNVGEAFRRLTNKCFEQNYKFTIGVDIFSEEVTLNSGAETIYLSIWDINRSQKFSIFRRNFYNGSVGALILIDLSDPFTLTVAKNLIEEIRMVEGKIPIFVYGINSQKNDSIKIHEEEISELNCIYFQLEDLKTIWTYLARKMFEFITGLNINNPQYRAYIESFKKSKHFMQEILQGLGYKIQGTNVDIFNKYGLFSININDGRTYFEPIQCSDCKNRSLCKKKNKNFICIVQKHNEFKGWSNGDILSDDILVLSKILAISEDMIPEDIHSQIDQARSCSVMK